MKKYLKTYLKCLLESMPLCGLFTLLNPAIIILVTPESLEVIEWPVLLAYFVCSSAVLGFLLFALPKPMRDRGIILVRSLFLLFVLVTVFYPEGGRRWDGVAPDFSSTYLTVLYSIYTATLALIYFLALKFPKPTVRIIIIASSLAFLAVPYAMFKSIPATKHDIKLLKSVENIADDDLKYASQKNIVIIMADMLQGSSVEQALLFNPSLQEEFQGFTAYTRASSPFPFTAYALPAMLTGNTYSSKSHARNDNTEAAHEDSLITDAQNNNYESFVLVHNELAPLGAYTYFYQMPARAMLSSSLSRIFKKYIWFDNKGKNISFQFLVDWKKKGKTLLERMGHMPLGAEKNKIFFVQHFIPHSPTIFDKQGQLLAEKNDNGDYNLNDFDTVANYMEETEFALTANLSPLKQMQRLGVYDDALIVIIGDHGHFSGTKEELYQTYPGAEDFKGFLMGKNIRAACMYNPAFLVKPPHATGSLKISHDAVGITDLRAIVQAYLRNDKPFVLNKIIRNWQKTHPLQIIGFTKENPSPYYFTDVHQVVKLPSNASSIPEALDTLDLRLEPTAYTLNTTSIPDQSNALLNSWLIEEKGAWLKDKTGLIYLQLKDANPQQQYHLRLTVTGLINDTTHPQQRVNVKINKQDIGMITVDKAGQQVVELPIPIGSIKDDGLVQIEFSPLDAKSPSSLNMWKFDLPISIYLYNFELK